MRNQPAVEAKSGRAVEVHVIRQDSSIQTKRHLGRLIDHVHLRVTDLFKAKRFYTAVLAPLGREPTSESGGHIAFDELWIDEADWRGASRVHLAFQAGSRDAVIQFYEAGLAAGGVDNGPPGLRKYHAHYFAAYLLDADNHNIEAVWHGPAQRSAPSIQVELTD